MPLMLIFNIATDAAVSTVIVGLLVWAIEADACGLWRLMPPQRRAARALRIEPAAVGAT